MKNVKSLLSKISFCSGQLSKGDLGGLKNSRSFYQVRGGKNRFKMPIYLAPNIILGADVTH